MTLLLGLILLFVAFLTGVTIVLFFVGPIMLLQPRRRMAEFYKALGQPVTPSELNLPYEEINVITADGLKLNSWLIKSETPAKGTILYLHGVSDGKMDGLRFAAFMHRHHYNVFLYDARRHGDSDGKFCTYGYYEKHDVITIVDYLLSRTDMHPGKIGLFGTSMGAAVALQAASLDSRIAAVVAENSFATLRSIFDDYQRRIIKLPFHYLRNVVIKRSESMAHFKANDVSPLDAVATLRTPKLFIYSSEDQLINSAYSLQIHENAMEPKELFRIDEASHHNTWDVAGEAYEEQLLAYFGRYVA